MCNDTNSEKLFHFKVKTSKVATVILYIPHNFDSGKSFLTPTSVALISNDSGVDTR
jgi:hypothetical protein